MKLRSLLCLLLPASGLLALPLLAQDQTQTSPVTTNTAAPLQLQENPVPAAAPSATPDAVTAASPVATPPASAETNTNAASLLPVDTNAAAQPTPNAFVPGPAPTNGEPAAPAPDSGMGSPGQNPPPSDPNSLIPPPEEPLPPSPINTAGNEETQRQKQKALYYSVKVQADKEEALSSLLSQADKAKSDEVKRQALREYYDLLAKRMKKIDSSISDWIDTMHAAYLRRLDQVRVEPTIPMNLPPTPAVSDDASPTPTPAASPKKKKKSSDEEMITASAKPKATPAAKATPSPSPMPTKKHNGIWPFSKAATPTPTPTPVTKKKVEA